MFWSGDTIVGEPCFGLEIGVLDGLRCVGFLHHQVAFGKALVGVAYADGNMLGHVVRCIVVQDRRTRTGGFVRIEYGRQFLICNLDRG
jgi:hypothetical protein